MNCYNLTVLQKLQFHKNQWKKETEKKKYISKKSWFSSPKRLRMSPFLTAESSFKGKISEGNRKDNKLGQKYRCPQLCSQTASVLGF